MGNVKMWQIVALFGAGFITGLVVAVAIIHEKYNALVELERRMEE